MLTVLGNLVPHFDPEIRVTTYVYILLALAIGYGLGRYRSFAIQNRGEALVSREITATAYAQVLMQTQLNLPQDSKALRY